MQRQRGELTIAPLLFFAAEQKGKNGEGGRIRIPPHLCAGEEENRRYSTAENGLLQRQVCSSPV